LPEQYPAHVQRAIDAARTRLGRSSSAARTVAGGATLREVVVAKGTPSDSPYRSQLEADYAAHLETLKVHGEIVAWWYEPERFHLGGGAWYKPDFRVMSPSGEIQFVEVKGHWREAARVRIKVAASLHPYRFTAVTRESGEWNEERF